MGKEKILVVGGGGFLGKALTKRLKDLGYECLSTSSKDPNSDNYLDLRDKRSIEFFCQKTPDIKGVIFLSGKEPQHNLKEITWDHLNDMIMIHFGGVLWCIKHLAEKITPGGFCVFTSSVAAKRGSYDPSYSSLKAAIEGLTRTLSRELAPKVRVNCISPGLVEDSPVFNQMTEEFRNSHLNTTPLKKFSSAADVSNAFLFLIENSSLTGQIIQINGGQVFG